MATVRVAVPVLKYWQKLHADKGRPWSIVEHAVLQGLVQSAASLAELESRGALPRRVVIEALVRLMRAGWVEIAHENAAIAFVATATGQAVAFGAELPNAPRRVVRSVVYYVDGATWSVFGNRELILLHERDVQHRAMSEAIVSLKSDFEGLSYDAQDVQRVVLDHDERFVAMNGTGQPPAQRYALVTVRDGKIVDGLPERCPKNLREAVLKVANVPTAAGALKSVAAADIDLPSPKVALLPERKIRFSASDIVLDGSRHRDLLSEVLEFADTRVYIHSTFISADCVEKLIPVILEAAKRGVRLHILWGQNEDRDEIITSRRAVDHLRNLEALRNLGDSLVIHPFSTGSHAKLILADSRKGQPFLGVIGSCNWLSSSFHSYEASIIVRDPPIVADIARTLVNISHDHNGIWSELTNDLARFADQISQAPALKNPNAIARVVTGSQHNDFVLEARDTSKSRIFVVSHRFGAAAENGVIAPLVAAAEDGQVQAEVFYCRTTAPIRARMRARIIEQAAAGKVRVEPVEFPRVHAKILAWDQDDVLVSSLNWLSADPMNRDSPKEVGLSIKMPNAANLVVDNFAKARQAEGVAPTS